MVEIVFKLKQLGVLYERGKELVIKSKIRIQIFNS